MTSPFMLDLLDLNMVFVVEMDALRVGMRIVLIYEGHLIAFIAKIFRLKQQALSTYKREMYVILHVITKLKHYL